MFQNCFVLDGLNTTNWNTEKVTTLSQTFRECRALTELDLSNWNLSNCTSMYIWIYGCDELTTLGDVSNLDTSNIAQMGYVFSEVDKLTVDVSNWDVSSVTDLSYFTNGSGGSGSITGYENWDTASLAGTLING